MNQIGRLVRPQTLVAIFLLALAVAGCSRKAPVYNVSSTPIAAASGQLSAGQVRGAIIRAATDRGWIVKQDDPGRIVLEVSFGDHRAMTTVDYSPTTYEITYYDSENLRYDGSTIHPNYNKLVKRLQRRILLQLNEA